MLKRLTYLAQANVAYATAAVDWEEKIGTQTWIALNNRGLEAWSAWRNMITPFCFLLPDPMCLRTYKYRCLDLSDQ